MCNEHHKLEKNLFLLLVFMVIVSSIGAIVEIFPLFIKEVAIEKVEGMRPHTPLELAGMEIYKREGCYGCHSQQIRALRDEVERYGHYSLAAESMYDHPFLWGSKRTGPDLARVGGKYSDEWHVQHMIAPRSVVPESIMPNYKFLADAKLDLSDMQKRLKVLRFLGVPYSEQDIEEFEKDIKIQLSMATGQEEIDSFLKRYPKTTIRKFNARSEGITEMDALIAYMQALGNKVDLKTNRGRDW
ncbi:MAG: cytochrome c oxidase, cbb3-type subunit [Candidatus Midichloriaceae bacterium]|jgi:cytochrome c oxidase cbb3-type subunit 2|nr:cytochrome c oxidase, cbb3-type subunit [Candidatus Midichloriaceae bacterium]